MEVVDRIPELDLMRHGVDFRFRVSLRNWTVTLRPLTLAENLQVAHSVSAEVAKMPVSARTPVTEQTYLAKETLKLASTSDVGKYDPQLTDPIMDKMTADEIIFLSKQYREGLDRVDPNLEEMTKDEVMALVDECKKKGDLSASAMTELSFFQRNQMLAYLLSLDG